MRSNRKPGSESLSVLILTTDVQIDRRTLQQANSLEAKGSRVKILAMPVNNDNESKDPRIIRLEMTMMSLGFKNYSLLSFYQRIRHLMPMNGHFMRFLKRLAWAYLANPEFFYLNLFSKALLQYNPHMVVAIDLPMLPAASALARRCGAKLIYDSHELYSEQELSRRERRRWSQIENKYIRDCDAVITVNPSIALELERRYKIKNVNVIYNAEHCRYDAKKNQLFHQFFSLSSERKILLFQGGLSKGRHLEPLVRAMCFVKNLTVDLIILGDGQLGKMLEQMISSMGLKNRVYLHQAVPQDRLLDYTQSADAGIIPYQATCLNNYYCTPNKLFEFIAAGIPILANDLPEISRIVMNHEIGLTGVMTTAKKLASLIDDFFSSEERFDEWRKNILVAQKQFCWGNEEKKLWQIFKDIQ